MKTFIKKISVIFVFALLPFAFGACNDAETPDIVKYSVNFLDADGTYLSVISVNRGEAPEYPGGAPQKDMTERETYTFVGWKSGETVYTELPAAMCDTVYTAVYATGERQYGITFSVNGKDTTVSYGYGDIPSYTGEMQWVENSVRYTIASWDSEFTPVKRDKTYTANVISEATVQVKFNVDGKSVIIDTPFGEAPVFYGLPYRKATEISYFDFTGWTDGTEFYTCDESLPPATSAAEYTAVFEEVYKRFTVKFADTFGILYETEVDYGDAAEYDGAPPQKAATEYANYVFVGWETEDGKRLESLPTVTENTVYYAVFEQRAKSFLLTVNYYYDGEKVSEHKAEYIFGDNCYIETPERPGCIADVPYVAITVTGDTVIDVTYKPSVVWDGSCAAFSGDGTENSPYLIESGAQLAYLSETVRQGDRYTGKRFKLAADLDLAQIKWTAIGSNAQPFDGVFDGDGHIVTGLYYDDKSSNTVANSGHGLFSTVSGVVKNLTVKGSVRAAARYSGIVVGNNIGGVVENCKSYGIIYGFGNSGGVVGINSGTVRNCINHAEIRDNGDVKSYRFGGVVGTITAGAVTGCKNYGAVVIEHATDQVGGVVGRSEGAATVCDCINYGYVEFNKNYTGGVIGYTSGTAAQKHCGLKNYAPVKGIGSVGGVVGYSGVTLENCFNYGGVTGTAARIGGIAGSVNINGVKVDGCKNYGDVCGAAAQVGGVVGYCGTSPVVTISACENRGKVSGAYYVGGIVGNTYTTTVTACVNYGDVSVSTKVSSADNKGFAGISGWTTTNSTVTGCVNYGKVNAYTNVGGVAGYLGAGSSVAQCANSGRIIGVTAVNSLIGLNNNK